MSLRTRLLVALGAVAFVALLVADVATYSALRSFLVGRVDQQLQTTHESIEQALEGPNGGGSPLGGPLPGGGSAPTDSASDGQDGTGCASQGTTSALFQRLAQGTFVELLGSSGSVTAEQSYCERGGTELVPRLPTPITGFSATANPGGEPTVYFDTASVQKGGPSFRVRASRLTGGDVLVIALPLSDVDGTLGRLLEIELAVTGGALVLSGLIGWWLVRLGLRPLAAIEKTAATVAQGELGHRVPGESPKTEVGRLAAVLNLMLGRIEGAFAARDATLADLRRSEGTLRQFVSDASHELRTPLAAVSAYAELFERGADQRPEDLGRVMTGIRAETARMGQLVDDLLLLARMDEGRPLERSPVELVALAAEAVDAAATVGPDWPVHLEASQPVEVVGDRARLRQVLDNLLSNVRAHTPPGTSTTFRIDKLGDRTVCQVIDDGPGIPPDLAERIFERFYRADASRTRSSGGSGLGLSIVGAIVAAHGGTVTAASRDGGGTVFTVTFPRGDQQESSRPDVSEAGDLPG